MYIILLILLSIAFIILATTWGKVHPFLALLFAAFLFGLFSGMPLETIISTINEGFGGTIGSIGIVIVVGLIIGVFLEKSGGAYALANLILRLIGERRVHEGMAAIGYLVSIPVFADSGFIILSPLNRALSKKAGISLAGTAVALSIGLMATHTMVPPTPGPIAAAGIIGADLGQVIAIGLVTSILALIACVIYAKWVGKRLPIDAAPELSEADMEAKLRAAPAAWKSFLPILVPILLIVLRSVAEYPTRPFGEGQGAVFLSFIGNPVTALFIGMLLALLLPKKLDRAMLSTSGWVGEALRDGAVIILITGAGGAFGKVLQSSGIGELLAGTVTESGLGIWLPFLIAAAIKSAQGSSTVAIITTASIVAPLLPAMGLEAGAAPALVVVAIGAGSAVVSHANDSFFWVVTQLSDLNVNQGYRTYTLATAILGFTAMLVLSGLSFFL